MSLKLTVCVFVFLVFNEVRSQVCYRTVRTTMVKTISQLSVKRACHSCGNGIIFITKSKMVAVTVNITECCNGYRKIYETSEASSANCLKIDQATHHPACEDSCMNGECSTTNECICYESYERYPPQGNTCVTKCGTGYERVNGDCQPEKCSCDEGWEVNDQDNCIPTCNPKCGYGSCVDVNKCNCWIGYELRENASPQCVPSCRDCYGDCIAPGKCICREPYTAKYLINDSKTICVSLTSTITSTSGSTTTNIEVHNHSPIPTVTTPRSTVGRVHTHSTIGLPKKISTPTDDKDLLLTLLYTAVATIIGLLIVVIVIIIYKHPAILDRFRASRCTEKTSHCSPPPQSGLQVDEQGLHYDYV